MIDIKNKKDCCGCAACAQICPKKAIVMISDRDGFLYPKIDMDKCVDCDLCNKVCQIENEGQERIPNHVYAVKNNNDVIRLSSSSGGLFHVLAERVLLDDGIVFGAAFDKDWNVVHREVSTLEELPLLYGSKYVQSTIGDTYKKVETYLKKSKTVLFSGTPCQVAGVQGYLRKYYDNLITVEVVCHGVPSPKIWKDFLREVNHDEITKQRLGGLYHIENISFRDKKEGWKKYRFVINLAEASAEGKKFVLSSTVNSFMELFLNNYILRPSCHQCHFRCGKSNADFTLADYWQIEHFYPHFFDDKGVSMLMTYNQNSMADFTNIAEDRVSYIETTYEEACYGNSAIRHDWPRKKLSGFFYFLHLSLGFNIKNSLIVCKNFNNIFDWLNEIIKRTKRFILRTTNNKN